MKKLIYLMALLGVAAGSFAFLPKEGEPTGYAILTWRYEGGKDYKVMLIGPEGKKILEEVKGPSISETVINRHEAEIRAINKLRTQGWKVNAVTETYFLLERQ